MSRQCVYIALVACVMGGCDGGLGPTTSQSRSASGVMRGIVTFDRWDSAGQVIDLRLVAFRVFPPSDIVGEVLGGRAVVYPPLGAGGFAPVGADSVPYVISLPVGTYQYVAIAQQFGPNNTADWRAVGQYDLDSNLAIPSSVTIVQGDTARGIDILVDFTNLPPPPF